MNDGLVVVKLHAFRKQRNEAHNYGNLDRVISIQMLLHFLENMKIFSLKVKMKVWFRAKVNTLRCLFSSRNFRPVCLNKESTEVCFL